MASKVAILGGGVGGLSAAHELIERGFAVSVFERNGVFGGKAQKRYVPNSGTGGRTDLPGEHGFRFFPAFYKHLPDTLMRIPFPSNVSVFNHIHGERTPARVCQLAARIVRAVPVLDGCVPYHG